MKRTEIDTTYEPKYNKSQFYGALCAKRVESTAGIAKRVGCSINNAQKYLEELEKERVIVKHKVVADCSTGEMDVWERIDGVQHLKFMVKSATEEVCKNPEDRFYLGYLTGVESAALKFMTGVTINEIEEQVMKKHNYKKEVDILGVEVYKKEDKQ